MSFSRELHGQERAKLLAHLLVLDAEDRRLRFTQALSDEGIRAYVERIDLSRDAVFVVTDSELAVTGAAHLARGDAHAELGVTVLPGNRRQGIGAALLERSAARARNWGVRVLFMNCLAENAAMMHLARKQGMRIAVSGGEAEAIVRLPQASLASLAADAVAEQLALFDHAQKAHWLALRGLLSAPPPTGADEPSAP